MTVPTLPPERSANKIRVIPNWQLISLVAFTTIGLIVGGVLYYDRQVQSIHQQKAGELESIAGLKVAQIGQWLQERLTDARMNSTDPFNDQAVAEWLANPGDAPTQIALLSRLQAIVNLEGYQNAFLAAADGSLLLSPDPSLTTLDAQTRQLAAQSFARREVILGDLIRNQESGKVYLNFAAPVSLRDGLPLAVLMLQIDPQKFLYPLIQSWPVLSQSAETLLIRRDGDDALYLNTLRFNDTPPLTMRIPLTSVAVPAIQAVLGHTGEFEGVDYRGVRVLSEIMPVPGTDWVMVAKVDTDEIFSQVNALGWFVVLIVTLAILMASALAAYAFSIRQRLLYQHLFQAERERRETQEEIQTTLYSIGDGVITTDAQGRVTRLNPVAERLTGWLEKEARSLPLETVFPIINEITRVPVENPVKRVLREGLVVGLANHTLLVARDGVERPIADSGAPIHSQGDGITGVVLVFRDQSEERAAQRERALLFYTVANSLNEIYLFDAQTCRFRFVNEGAQKNLGYSQEQLLTLTLFEIKTELSIESFQAMVTPLLTGQTTTRVFETVNQRADGSRYPVEVHLQLFDYEGEQVFLSVVSDITDRRRAEKTLLDSEARLVQAQAVAHVGNWELNLADRTMWASAEAFQIYGVERTSPYLSLEQVQGMVHPEDRPHADALLQALIRGEGSYNIEFRIRRASDGAQRMISSIANLERDGAGNPAKVVGVIQDITERRQAEDALRESETRFRTLFEQAALGVGVIDSRTGRYIDINQKYCDFLGYTRAEMLNLSFEDVSDPEGVQENIAKNALLLAGKIREFTIEKRYIRKDGSKVWGELTASPLWMPGEEPIHPMHIAVVNDITGRKHAEARVAEQLDELRRWHTATLGREMRIVELKTEVNDILTEAGQPPRYASPEEILAHE